MKMTSSDNDVGTLPIVNCNDTVRSRRETVVAILSAALDRPTTLLNDYPVLDFK